MKIPVGIEKVLYLAATDPAFREALFADRTEALGRPGVGLSPDEAAILKCIPDDRLNLMIGQIDPSAHGKRFMQKVAACAVALAATTAAEPTVAGRAEHGGSADADIVELDRDNQWGIGIGGVLVGVPKTTVVSIGSVHGTRNMSQRSVMESLPSERSLETQLEKGLPRAEQVSGWLGIEMTVDRNGVPISFKFSKNSMADNRVRNCIKKVFAKVRFPKPSSGQARVSAGMEIFKPANPVADTENTLDETADGLTNSPKFNIDIDATGSLDAAVVREAVERNRGELRYCFEKELTKDPQLRSTIAVKFEIDRSGTVWEVFVDRDDGRTSLATCLVSRLVMMRFPPPGEGTVSVRCTMHFGNPDQIKGRDDGGKQDRH